MGFLKSFFGAAAANAIRDSKKEQELLEIWNALFDEASDYLKLVDNNKEKLLHYFSNGIIK